jgi:hypothetical protein
MKKFFTATAGAIFFSMAAVSTAQAARIGGETISLGDGTISSWVDVDENELPLAVGITFTESALSGLPTSSAPGGFPLTDGEHVSFEYELLLPEEAPATAFSHVGLNWNPEGHHPDRILGLPHFDVHFNTISPEERHKITATGDDLEKVYNLPPEKFWPNDYQPAVAPEGSGQPGSEEPGQGLHWYDSSSAPYNREPFTQTYLYGSYDGEFVFWEPMLTKAYLETYPNITVNLEDKLPENYHKSGYYPTEYNINYEPTSREYSVSLSGLTYRSVPEPSSTLGILAFAAFAAGSMLRRTRKKQKAS